ncbi:MAG: universal stress protein [Alphaproteobacteria bacterium]|nr:universal stress protein [Alphaproteobacteria bacterium]
MSTLDRFESVFNAAAREVFAHQSVEIGRVLLVHDLVEALQDDFLYLAKGFLSVLEARDKPDWELFGGDSPFSVREVLNAVEQAKPDLVVTYRHLHSAVGEWPHSLGEHVDVLTQATSTPVLVLPHPGRKDLPGHALKNTGRVMAVTDHLAGDHRLVSHAAHFTQDGGTLYLAHVEDDTVFERYIAAIGKIPDLDTDIAREEIRARLVEDPTEYIESCCAGLAREPQTLKVESRVKFGHQLADYRGLVEENEIDLLVMYTKDDEQLAMHGIAYPLAVELRATPLLLL